MPTLSLASWNVNGIRAVARKGFFDWLRDAKPDIVGIQETKISADQLSPEVVSPPGYLAFFNHAERRGYSGVAIYSRKRPLDLRLGMGVPKFDAEGRVILAEFRDFTLVNAYFPSGTSGADRLAYKLEFNECFLKFVTSLSRQGKRLVICGDFNTAHREIDLARPKENMDQSGFLPEERKWLDRFIRRGYIDTFRDFCREPHHYSWWHMRSAARERNVGWRIDYIFAAQALRDNLVDAAIEKDVMGSDHCPVTLKIRF